MAGGLIDTAPLTWKDIRAHSIDNPRRPCPAFLELKMLPLSYFVAAAAMTAAALYLFLRLRLFVTTSSMLLGALLLVYGPALISFTLSGRQYAFLIHALTGAPPTFLFPNLEAKVGSLSPIIVSINFSVALMYLGIILGFECVERTFPKIATQAYALTIGWNKQALSDDARQHRILLVVIVALFAVMLLISIREDYLRTIVHFFSIKNDNTVRNLYRAHFGGSSDYLYRVVLSAVAPMFVVWGVLAGAKSRSWLLLLAAFLLFAIAMLGKVETLSKAPPTFFILQIILAGLLVFTNRISWRVAIVATVIFCLLIYITTRMIIVFSPDISPLESVYSRIFEVENETLVENFAVFPRLHPFMWGMNLRPIAALLGAPYTPSFSIVAYIWYHSHDITSPTLFIADAWADFSYVGVLVYSIVAGAICRGIDIAFLRYGKSTVAIAVLSATFWGVLTLITTALNIALVTGGLLLAPLLAAMVVLIARRKQLTA